MHRCVVFYELSKGVAEAATEAPESEQGSVKEDYDDVSDRFIRYYFCDFSYV